MRLPVFFAVLAVGLSEAVADPPAPDFATVYRLLDERCLECHAKDDYEGGLVMEDHASLLKGGETGVAVVPSKSKESLLMRYVRGEVEKDGKRRFMPPGKREKLSKEEIALVAAWIDAGAKPAAGPEKPRELVVQKVAPKVPPRLAINSLAYEPKQRLLAVGRYGLVELVAAESRQVVRRLTGVRGSVNAVEFSPDGTQLFAASGENAIVGEVKQWSIPDGRLIRTFEGHRDTIYAMDLSPDGQVLATGSYDQQIKLWDVATGKELRTLRGHNGGVFAVAFRPDGKILASASADRTVKLWDAATGQRRDTLSQPTKEQVALAWSADGKRLAAGGFDNRLRVWEVTAEAKETTNPLLVSRFAHEGPVTRLLWSGDGQTLLSSGQDATVKRWDPAEIKERLVFEKQPDWPSALALAGKTLVAGRLDGTLGYYDCSTAQPMPAPKPEPPATLGAIEPPGVQRGTEAMLTLKGTNLLGITGVRIEGGAATAELIQDGSAVERKARVKIPDTLKPGTYQLTLLDAEGKPGASSPLFIGEIPQVFENSATGVLTLPATYWGVLGKAGEKDMVEFEAKAGETLTFDLAAKSIGSKADAVLSLVNAEGRVLETNNDFDGTGDPFFAHTFTEGGRFRVVVRDQEFTGSDKHSYRLTVGALPYVTGCFPLGVEANRAAEIQLIGYNLPRDAKVSLPPTAPGEATLPAEHARRPFRIAVTELPHVLEAEPNDTPATATVIAAPCSVAGIIHNPKPGAGDLDLYRFHAEAGSRWVIETDAARRSSPVDTKIEVLHADGKPVERLLLQAVRDSAITFRAIDSVTADARVDNWREMDLNQLLYLGGEVAKIYRMPEGPDSGFEFYKINGRRAAYFNTTATAHSLDEPCYIVEPHAPGTRLLANGLPLFTLYYENDDDGERVLGSDSRLLFTAPAAGDYLVAVRDSRGLSGDRFVYQLTVRPPRPDFAVRVNGRDPKVSPGSGQPFTLVVERQDAFDDEVRVDISGLPPGWTVTSPLVIQAGHQEAKGTLHAVESAKEPTEAEWQQVKITATAMVDGKEVKHAAGNLGKIALAKPPELFVALEPAAPGDSLQHLSPPTPMAAQNPAEPLEITIAPGETIPAWIKIRRQGLKSEVRFDVENLPHGMIVDNLGLNGITLLPGQDVGEIHLRCDPWVSNMDRLCYAVTRSLGTQTSLPVVLHVRKKDEASIARSPH